MPTTAPAGSASSFWSPAGPWELVLFGVGILLTLAVVAFFIVVMARSGRESGANDE